LFVNFLFHQFTMNENKPYAIFEMEILDRKNGYFHIKINKGELSCLILFNPEDKELRFSDETNLASELIENSYQLRKILHNKRTETYYIGFKLKFILRNNENAISLNDLNKLVILDRRNGLFNVSSIEKEEKEILKIYTDGSYLEKNKKGAFIALIENTNGLLNLHCTTANSDSSSLMELMAVIEGLKYTQNTECVRIVCDSRYVIKGLTEWMFNWKLNDWHTAQGEKVKNIKYWQEFDQLSQNKYIEFEWVKAHSKHFYNSICDYYAKQAASRV
jgi:ribonuclease HI